MARKRRQDGRYQIQIELPLQPGDKTRRRKYFYGKTLTEARKKRDDFLAIFTPNRGVKVTPDICLSEWSQMWLEDVRGTYTDHAFQCQRSAVKRITTAIGNVRVRDVSPHDIQSYMSSLSGCSKSLIYKQRQTITAIFRYAVSNGLIADSPCKDIRSPKGTYAGHRVVTESERKVIADSWRSCRAAAWALVMMYTGLRRGELCGLMPSDIDYDEMMIRVRRAAVLAENSKLKEPKTEKGIRSVPLFPIILDVIRIAEAEHGERLFSDSRGRAVTDVTFRSNWESMRSRLGIEIQAHDLRYTYASMLHDADVDVLTAAKLLGHKDIKVTMGIYTKLSEQKERSDLERLRSYVNGCQMAVK